MESDLNTEKYGDSGILSESNLGSNELHMTVTNGVEKKYENAGTAAETEFKFSRQPDLEDLRQLQSDFVRERNWDQYHQPRNLLLAMVGEVGEVAELFQWKGEVKDGLPDWTEKEKSDLAQELSDVFIYLIRLAEKCHVDLPSAVLEKMALNKLKYPAHKAWGSCKKYNEY